MLENFRANVLNSTFLTWKTGWRISRGLHFWQSVGPLLQHKKTEELPAKHFSFQIIP